MKRRKERRLINPSNLKKSKSIELKRRMKSNLSRSLLPKKVLRKSRKSIDLKLRVKRMLPARLRILKVNQRLMEVRRKSLQTSTSILKSHTRSIMILTSHNITITSSELMLINISLTKKILTSQSILKSQGPTRSTLTEEF